MRLIIILSTVLGLTSLCFHHQLTQNPKDTKTQNTVRRGRAKSQLTTQDIRAVILAVEDEIYDYGYEPRFYQMGENMGVPTHWRARLPIYINPTFDGEGMGQVIYKLMPHGEVFRYFDLSDKGLVLLDGDPGLNFPPTQPSLQTVYMDDDELCGMKHAWIRQSFDVDTAPSPEMVQDAVRRQKLRTGFSAWEYRHNGKNDR